MHKILLSEIIYFPVCYVVMEPFAGSIAAILVSLLYATSAKLVGTGTMIGDYEIWKVATTIHVSAWILQFIGHAVFESEIIYKFLLERT